LESHILDAIVSSRVLDFGYWVWHKTAVPTWLERFVLTLLAGAFLGVVLWNSMKLDITQRITLGIVILALSYFVAHTVYKGNIPEPPLKPDFATANPILLIQRGNGAGFIAGLYKVGDITVMQPIDFIAIIQITARDKPITLNSISLELQTPNGWMPLRKLPSNIMQLYFGEPQKAFLGTLDRPDLSSFLGQDIEPWKTISGFGIYEYGSTNFIPANNNPIARVTLADSLGETIRIELIGKGDKPADPFASGTWSIKVLDNARIDLTKFNERRFFGSQ
jgi:hypothetical protein